jgi:predicted RNA-binding protein with PIN domain
MKFTFGKTSAAQRLEQLVENSPTARRKISVILSDYTNQLLLVTQTRDPRTVRLCMELLRDYTLRRLDVKKHLTDEMRTYAQNVVITRYRAFRRGFDAVSRAIEAGEKQKKNS